VTGPAFEATITGTGSLHINDDEGGSAKQEDNGAPQVQEVPARIYSRLGWVLGLTFAMLALGGAYLYRRGAA
jgi:hypothetical protein